MKTKQTKAHQYQPIGRWLILRRLSQFTILGLFLAGPLFAYWLIKGNLSSSVILETLALTDPYLAIQSLFAQHQLTTTVIIGALVVAGFYIIVGGRVYCAWVCPVNIITDTAFFLRRLLKIQSQLHLNKNLRYWLLAMTLMLAMFTGRLVWELVNPVSILQRSLIFGLGLTWLIVLAIFLLELLISRHVWCGHLCPMGAFYSLLGNGFVQVNAKHREQCDDCMDCFIVCPEPQVIKPALKPQNPNHSRFITNINCTHCGRCIEVCSKQVFQFDLRS